MRRPGATIRRFLWAAALAMAAAMAAGGCSTDRRPGPAGGTDGGNGAAGGDGEAPADAPNPAGGDRRSGEGGGGSGGECEGGACGGRPLGTACAAGAECQSGACVDGVCCDGPCTGACLRCNQPDQPGRCLPVEDGTPDPRGICGDEGASSCGRSGRCNGQGGCARHPAGTRCAPAACTGADSMSPGATCDGQGGCVPGPAISCDPFMCAGGACRDSCTGDGDCMPPATCNVGSCGKRGLGQSCTTADDCKSGFCADGVCCSEECSGPCRFCALVSALGRCVDVAVDTPDPRRARGVTDPASICPVTAPASCGTNGACDGAGGCQLYPRGRPCAAERCDPAANSHTPVATCNGQGQCVPPPTQSCAPFRCGGSSCAAGCSGDGDCVAPAVCQQGSCGQRPTGQPCATAAECQSGLCAQGVCCASACTGSCLSCAVPGMVGTCANVPAGLSDPAGACGPTCSADGSGVQNRRCDGASGCAVDPTVTPCGAYQCRAGRCLATCATDADCGTGNVCTAGSCGVRNRRAAGAACMSGAECLSGHCVNGTCCTVASCGACQTCASPAGLCVSVAAGTPCGNATCSADNRSSLSSTCDAQGACQGATPVSCGAFVCRGGACLTRCAGDEDCVTGRCRGFTCR